MAERRGERRYTEKQKPSMVDGKCGKGSGVEAGSMADDRMHYGQRGATTHQLKASLWPEEQGSQEGGGQSTEEYQWRKNCTESLKQMVEKR